MIMTQGSHNRIYPLTRDTHDYIILQSLFPTSPPFQAFVGGIKVQNKCYTKEK